MYVINASLRKSTSEKRVLSIASLSNFIQSFSLSVIPGISYQIVPLIPSLSFSIPGSFGFLGPIILYMSKSPFLSSLIFHCKRYIMTKFYLLCVVLQSLILHNTIQCSAKRMKAFCLFQLLILLVSINGALCKECTNIPTQLSSHTLRYELLSSNNESWREEMFSHYHLIPTDELAWSNLFPRRFLREEQEFEWIMTYRKLKNSAESNSPGDFLKEVSLHDVRLDPSSVQWRAQQTNLEYLLLLDVDSLVWSFRETAGLPTPGTAYGGWEKPSCELRGHFVG